MSVSSIGPFQSAPVRDLSDLDLVEGELTAAKRAASGIEPESAPDDSTADQENRGFIHLADYLEEYERKKAQSRDKNKGHSLLNKYEAKERLVLKYRQLDSMEETLQDKGQFMDKAI